MNSAPKYIVGYDGSAAARAAAVLAARLAGPVGAEVIAAFVLEEPDAWASATVLLHRPFEREEADHVLAELGVDGVATVRIEAGSPARGLHDLALSAGADLLAVGATHHGVLGRLAPGSVAMHLLHGAPCPMLIVPPETGEREIRSIAVAYDGRPESRVALDAAAELAVRLEARLLLVGSVTAPMITTPVTPIVAPQHARDPRAELLERLERVVVPGDAEVERRALVGPAGALLTEVSAGVDLLVCGSRGYGPVGSVLLGSVSRHLVDHAACPVLVVPRANARRKSKSESDVPTAHATVS